MSAALSQAFAALAVPVSLTLFQVLVILLIVAMLAAVAGMVWGAGVRDHLDEQYMGRDIAADARAGRIERRLQPRGGQPVIPQPTPERRDQASVPPRVSTPRCCP